MLGKDTKTEDNTKTRGIESEKEVIRVKKNPTKIEKVNPRSSKEGHD